MTRQHQKKVSFFRSARCLNPRDRSSEASEIITYNNHRAYKFFIYNRLLNNYYIHNLSLADSSFYVRRDFGYCILFINQAATLSGNYYPAATNHSVLGYEHITGFTLCFLLPRADCIHFFLVVFYGFYLQLDPHVKSCAYDKTHSRKMVKRLAVG